MFIIPILQMREWSQRVIPKVTQRVTRQKFQPRNLKTSLMNFLLGHTDFYSEEKRLEPWQNEHISGLILFVYIHDPPKLCLPLKVQPSILS